MNHLDTLARLRARSEEAGRYVLPLNRAWADKAQAAYDELHRASTVLVDPNDPESDRRIANAQAEVDRIVEAAGDEVVVFRFRRLGRAQYEALVSRHPVTAEMRKEDEEKAPQFRRVFNMETFGPELLELVMFDPKLPREAIVELVNGPPLEVDEQGHAVITEPALMSRAEAEALLASAMTSALDRPRSLPSDLTLP